MHRLLAFVVALTLLLAAVSARSVAAQGDGAALPQVGDPVTFPLDAEGELGEATVTVEEVIDPFEELADDFAPEDETRYVLATVTVENGGDEVLSVDPATIFVQDADGFIYRAMEEPFAAEETEPAPLVEPADIDGGETAEAAVGFAVPEDAVLTAVYHDPDDDRLITLAVLEPASSGDEGTAEADDDEDAETPEADDATAEANDATAEADDEDADDEGEETPEADDEGTAATSGDLDCGDVETYYDDTDERLVRLNEIVDGLINLDADTAAADPTGTVEQFREHADELEAFAVEQEDEDVPAGLEDLNDAGVEMFETLAEGFDQVADAFEAAFTSGDTSGLAEAQATIIEGGELNAEFVADLNAVAEDCGIETVASS